MPHKAIWLTSTSSLEHRTIQESYHAGANQLLVSVAYSGINPADVKHATIGMKDLVPGYDYSGTVISAPAGSRFKPGDRVAGTAPSGYSRGSRCGTHQDVIVAEESMTFAVPDYLPMQDAAALGVVLRTAAIALYSRLRLPFPWEPKVSSDSTPALLIWGGATGVGLCALQLAARSGANPIYVTASIKHHASLAELGATHCFDYRSDSVWADIKAAVAASGKSSDLVFDTVGSTAEGHMGDACFEIVSDPATANIISCGPYPKRAAFFFAMPDRDVDFMPPKSEQFWMRENPEEAKIMFRVMDWVVENYGTALKIPRVRTVSWGEAVEELRRSAEGGNSFEKTVVDHASE